MAADIKALIAAATADLDLLKREAAAANTLSTQSASTRPRSASSAVFGRSAGMDRMRSTRQGAPGMPAVDAGADPAPLRPERSDRLVRQAAPSFTMGSSRRGDRAAEAERPLSYVEPSAASNRKRTIGGAFSSTPRFVQRTLDCGVSPIVEMAADPASAGESASAGSAPYKRVMTDRADEASRSYSFGRAERCTTSASQMGSARVETDPPESTLTCDIERADKYLRPHTTGPTMVTPSSTRKCTALAWEDSRGQGSGGFVDDGVALNTLLSHRERAPTVVMRPKCTELRKVSKAPSTSANLNPFQTDDEFGLSEIFGYSSSNGAADASPALETPGPGYYDPKTRDIAGGRIYFQPKAKKKIDHDFSVSSNEPTFLNDDEFGLSEILCETGNHLKLTGATVPGPGAYAVDTADAAVRTSVPSFSYRAPAEEKYPTKQLERKRYFEEKAKDAREGYLTDPNVTLVQERSKGGLILPAKKVGIDWRNRVAIARMQHERDRIAGIGYYEADKSIIEKRVVGAVAMSQEIVSRKKTEDKILSKPGVAHVKVVREREKVANDQFLGPQLQVPWSVSDGVQNKRQRKEDADDLDVDEDMEEVYDLLNMRRDNSGNPQHYGDYSEAYLRSSLAGIDRGTGLVPMSKGKPVERGISVKKLTASEREQEYLSTQVHHDWGAPDGVAASQQSGANLLRLDLVPGRETKKVKKKGVVEVQDFDAPVRNYDNNGPGKYGPDEILEFGKSVGGVVPFKDVVSRSEATGPAGQPSEAAKEKYRKIEQDIQGSELYLAAEAAKDANRKEPPRAYTLYAQDRFPIEKLDENDPGLNHLGGSFFEGMNEEVESRRALVRYDRMVGRTDTDLKKSNVAIDDFDIDIPVTGDELDLEVNDWKPHMVTTHAVKWVDAVDLPRFDKTKTGPKDDDAPLTVSPKYDQVHQKEAFMVNMSKQRGHFEEDAVLARGDEYMPDDAAANVARSLDNAVERGRIARSTSKRVPIANLGKPSEERGLQSKAANGDDEVYIDLNDAKDRVGLRQGIGVPVITKQQDRGLNLITKREEQNVDEEKLNISPHAEYKSSWKRTNGGKWNNHPADAKMIRIEDEQLDISPNSEKYIIGSGINKGGAAMSKQIGRDGKQNKKPFADAKKIIGTEDSEQLDIDAMNAPKKIHSSVDWSKNEIPRRLYQSQDPDTMQNLVIDPDEARSNIKIKESYARISNQPSRSQIIYDDSKNHSELILSPKQSLTRATMKPQLSWNKQLDVKLPKFTESQELDLSPRDDILRQGLTKNLPWRKESPTKSSGLINQDDEELILSPSDTTNHVQTTRLPSWSKQSERIPGMYQDSEELILSPRDDANRRMSNKGIAEWGKQAELVRHTGFSPVQGPRDADDDEIILSPSDATSRRNVNRATVSWSRQADPIITERANLMNNGDEELKLSTAHENDRNNAAKHAVAWDKQKDYSDTLLDRYGYSDELMLYPTEIPRAAAQENISWLKQTDAGNINAKISGLESEELILSPSNNGAGNKNKNILSWAKQAEDSSRGKQRPSNPSDLDDEQLMLSPNESNRAVPSGSKAPAWNKQSDVMERPLKDQEPEELMLFPKKIDSASVVKGAGLWTKLSGPGAGANDGELQKNYFNDSDELILSPKRDASLPSFPNRGKFSKKERNEEEGSVIQEDDEELILSIQERKGQSSGVHFSKTDLGRHETKYRDEEELIISPKFPNRISASGTGIWTKGADFDADHQKLDNDDEELYLSPKMHSRLNNGGEFRKSDRATGIGGYKFDEDEELKLSPKAAEAYINRGNFGQSERLPNEGHALYDKDEELKLEPKQAQRLNSSSGAGLFGRAADYSLAGMIQDREEEELKLSPHSPDPFSKNGALLYKESEIVENKVYEDEELKLSPKAAPKNLGGRMAPLKPYEVDLLKPKMRTYTKTVGGSKVESAASSVVSASSSKRAPSANREELSAIVGQSKPSLSNRGVQRKSASGSVASKSALGAKKTSSTIGTKSYQPPLASPLVSPPLVPAPSPQPLIPAHRAASRYLNVTESTDDQKLSNLMKTLKI